MTGYCQQLWISIHSLRMEGDASFLAALHRPAAFQSTPSVWRETPLKKPSTIATIYFNPLPPYGGRPCSRHGNGRSGIISIHSLRMEGDVYHLQPLYANSLFQSTPSVWRETLNLCPTIRAIIISIHSLRMEGDSRIGRRPHDVIISIHSLRMEGDLTGAIRNCIAAFISIHSLRMEGDHTDLIASERTTLFQSTPSVWRETQFCGLFLVVLVISIHSLRMEGDRSECRGERRNDAFQSTPSVWRETSPVAILYTPFRNFNPLPPYGGRPVSERRRSPVLTFQSTPSVWRETSLRVPSDTASKDFNPLPPYGGRPPEAFMGSVNLKYFNPLPPYGGRL